MDQLKDAGLDIYYCHLKANRDAIIIRFKDLVELKIQERMFGPFETGVKRVSNYLKEELINLQNNFVTKAKFGCDPYKKLWMQIILSYPLLRQETKLFIIVIFNITFS